MKENWEKVGQLPGPCEKGFMYFVAGDGGVYRVPTNNKAGSEAYTNAQHTPATMPQHTEAERQRKGKGGFFSNLFSRKE